PTANPPSAGLWPETIDIFAPFKYYKATVLGGTPPVRILMYRLFLLFGLAAVISLSAFSQQPVPTPLPEDQVVKINTNLIQIDVPVTDKDGKIVTGLKPEDFELYENGEIQKITNFSFVSKIAGGATLDSANAPVPVSNGNSPLKQGSVRRTIALVVDDLNLSF